MFENSNQVIRQLRQAMGHNFPIIGVGGVLSGGDAAAKIKQGAVLVQSYPGLIFKVPGLGPECAPPIKPLRP